MALLTLPAVLVPLSLHLSPSSLHLPPTQLQSPISMMARPKGGSKKKVTAASAGGFGAPKPPPPTLDEVVAGFPTRLPKDTSVDCPCGDGRSYDTCCQPYHKFMKVPESPEWCLRSRYVGFCYRQPKYIISTTSKSNSDWQDDKVKWARRLNKEQMFDSFKFVSLDILNVEEGETEREAFIDMKVTLQPIDEKTGLNTQAEPMVFAERSRFTQNAKGAWLYASGEVTSEVSGLKGRVLNSEQDLGRLRSDVEFVRGVEGKTKKK